MANVPSSIEEEVQQRIAYKSPYEQWKEAEGLPTYRGLIVKNLYELELAPWRSSGVGSAAFLNLDGTGGFNDAYVAEIPAGKSLKAHRHLFEETIYDPQNGAPINSNLADYMVTVNADAPPIDVTFLDYPDKEINELGARGIGEIGLAGIAAAITDAVYHATGVRVRELPVKIEDLLV